MNQMRKFIGLGFCAIAAFLFATRYICAAIYGSGAAQRSEAYFCEIYKYVGSSLSVAAGIALFVGIVYLFLDAKTSK